jgi:hypothetical protein
MPDFNISQDLCAGAYHHVIAQGGVAFSSLNPCSAQGDVLVKRYIFAYLCRFSNHDAHSVVNEKSGPNPGPRMNFHSCQEADHLRQDSGKQGNAEPGVKKMN